MKKTIILLTAVIFICGCGSEGYECAKEARAPAPCATPEKSAQTTPVAQMPQPSEPGLVPAETPAEPSDVTMEKPPTDITENFTVSTGYVDVFVEPAGRKLGAYDLVVKFDPAVVRIARIERVDGGFPGAPMVSPDSFASGSTRIISLQAGRQVSGSRIAVARVYFRPVSAGRSAIYVEVKDLYDPGSQRVLGSAVLSTDEVTVTR